MSDTLTPQVVEKRLRDLSKEIDEAHEQAVDLEIAWHKITTKTELALARSRIMIAGKSSPTGRSYTVGEREDMAKIENASLIEELATTEALVKAARANTQRLKTQVDIARSVGTLLRSSLELL